VSQLSLRARLVLGVLVLATIGLVAADVSTYASLRSFLLDRVDTALEADHRAAEGGPGPGDNTSGQAQCGPAPNAFVQIRSASGVVLCSSEVPHFPGTAAPSPPRLPATIDLPAQTANGSPDRFRYFTVPAQTGGGRYRVRASIDPGSSNVLVIASSLSDVDSTLHRLFLIELLVTAAVAVAIALLGLWIVRLGLRPLEEIGKTADAIAAGDLTQRVKRAEPRTEVGRLGLGLNAMLSRIEASDRRLRRFIADASHELRTPLAAVRAYAELFERGADRRPDDLARAMKGISRESERMSGLVEDLLLLARLDEGRKLEREPVRLDELAAEAVETSRAVDASHPIELELEPATVLGDRRALRQVVDNLLGNIRSHTPPGTLAHVRVRAAGGDATVEIADEGPGMTEEQADRIFERFYRADPSRSRDSGGAGLGLAIVSAVTEAHGGAISLSTSLGGGATFRITLPDGSHEAHSRL
jgi:two-component system OmpR family sensor kinase